MKIQHSSDISLNRFSNIYFVGAGGIGMAALVRYFLSLGKSVAGYDRTSTHLTDMLVSEGADISFADNIEAVPDGYRDKATTLVVYTPAIPETNIPLSFFRKEGFVILKRAEVLGMITRHSKGICFAGTHGKTTTSSMAAHILASSPVGCNAFLGGILRNYDSNLILCPASPFTVIEADEYDRSFHHLEPYIAVVTATDPDHLDIYGTEEAYLESFSHFTSLIRPDGKLLVRTGLKFIPKTAPTVEVYTYSKELGDYHASNIRRGNGGIVFDFIGPGIEVKDISLGVPVEINIENAVASLAACHLTGQFDAGCAASAMASFLGAERRFQFWVKQPGADGKVIIDDYAHHPDELRQSILSVKALYPERPLTVAFQPHLYSRTRDFAREFGEALSLADDVILVDIYPAREEPIPGVTSAIIFDHIDGPSKTMVSKSWLPEAVASSGFSVLLTAGAGDIIDCIPEIVKPYINADGQA